MLQLGSKLYSVEGAVESDHSGEPPASSEQCGDEVRRKPVSAEFRDMIERILRYVNEIHIALSLPRDSDMA